MRSEACCVVAVGQLVNEDFGLVQGGKNVIQYDPSDAW